MKAFLLAAGYGERLRPLTDMMPKPLAPVCNAPCLCAAVALIREAGIVEVVCNLHYRPGDIEEFIGSRDNFGLNFRFSREERILGTGGGLKHCQGQLGGGPVFLINGDVISDLDTAAFMKEFLASGLPAMAVLREMPAGETGTVAVRDGMIADFRGTLGSGLPHRHDYTGIAALSPEAFAYLSDEPTSVVYTAFTALASLGRMGSFTHRGLWLDIGSAALYRGANLALLGRPDLRERIRIQTGAAMDPVSPDAAVSPGAEVSVSVIGDRCRIAGDSAVSDSVLLPGVEVHSGERIERSVCMKSGDGGRIVIPC